jgi:hypothetical protein
MKQPRQPGFRGKTFQSAAMSDLVGMSLTPRFSGVYMRAENLDADIYLGRSAG